MTKDTFVFESLAPLNEIVARKNIRAKKALGQNFLFDLNITRKIARVGILNPASPILEIGPGPGGLTRALFLEGATQVTVIEKDVRFLSALDAIHDVVGDKLVIFAKDALDFDLAQLNADHIQIIANLPYNIGTHLLVGWLHDLAKIQAMTLLLQKEVCSRLTAAHSTDAYGRLSVLAQLTCHVKTLFDIPPEAFTPAPKVTSTVVQLIPRNDRPNLEMIQKIGEITQMAFSQRRKMLRSSLKPVLVAQPDLLGRLNIDSSLRAENLSPQHYLAIVKGVTQV